MLWIRGARASKAPAGDRAPVRTGSFICVCCGGASIALVRAAIIVSLLLIPHPSVSARTWGRVNTQVGRREADAHTRSCFCVLAVLADGSKLCASTYMAAAEGAGRHGDGAWWTQRQVAPRRPVGGHELWPRLVACFFRCQRANSAEFSGEAGQGRHPHRAHTPAYPLLPPPA